MTNSGLRVLRIPLLGLRVSPDEFLDQVEVALRSAGWKPEIQAKRPNDRGQ